MCVLTFKPALPELACERSYIYSDDGCGQATVSTVLPLCPRHTVHLQQSVLTSEESAQAILEVRHAAAPRLSGPSTATWSSLSTRRASVKLL